VAVFFITGRRENTRAHTESNLTREGIVANVGDQYSDLAGGHEDIGFKLANPFYFLP
jgi:hypothetical protein